MYVIKVLNNSLVLSKDSHNREVIVMGKGIGFNSKVGDVLCPSTIEKIFVVQTNLSVNEYVRLLENTPPELIEIVNTIITQAQDKLKGQLNTLLFFTLIDHLSFAIERYHKGITTQNRLLYEVKRFYPLEFEVAKYGLNFMNNALSIMLPEEEAGNIAFHLVNAQTDTQQMENTMLCTKMLKDIFNIIQYNFNISFDKNTLGYARFLTHLQFFIQRFVEGNQIKSKDNVILKQIIKEYPNEYKCSLLIQDYVKNLLNMTLSNDEILYLTIHIIKIT